MEGKMKWIILSSLFVVLVLFTLFLGVSIFLIFKFSNIFNTPPESTHNEYQFTEVNPFDHTSKTGFVTISQSLGTEDHISYFNKETSSSVIITNFGGEEYECSGACHCSEEDPDTRRIAATGNLLTRGLLVLLTAFSSSMALRLAEETFQNQCTQRFSHSCDPSLIHSEVIDCEKPVGEHADEEENEKVKNSEKQDVAATYHCKGYCLHIAEVDEDVIGPILPGLEISDYVKVGKEYIGKCEKFKMDMVIEMDYRTMLKFKNPQIAPHFTYKDFKYKNEHMMAIDVFGKGPFNRFCRKNSIIREQWWDEKMKGRIHDFDRISMDYAADHPNFKMRAKEWVFKRAYCYGYPIGAKRLSGLVQAAGTAQKKKIENVKCVKVRSIKEDLTVVNYDEKLELE